MLSDMTADTDADTTALQRAIDLAGNQTKLAEQIGVRQQTVSYWATNCDGIVPAEHCPAIERALDGRITRYELRPDIFGAAPVMA